MPLCTLVPLLMQAKLGWVALLGAGIRDGSSTGNSISEPAAAVWAGLGARLAHSDRGYRAHWEEFLAGRSSLGPRHHLAAEIASGLENATGGWRSQRWAVAVDQTVWPGPFWRGRSSTGAAGSEAAEDGGRRFCDAIATECGSPRRGRRGVTACLESSCQPELEVCRREPRCDRLLDRLLAASGEVADAEVDDWLAESPAAAALADCEEDHDCSGFGEVSAEACAAAVERCSAAECGDCISRVVEAGYVLPVPGFPDAREPSWCSGLLDLVGGVSGSGGRKRHDPSLMGRMLSDVISTSCEVLSAFAAPSARWEAVLNLYYVCCHGPQHPPRALLLAPLFPSAVTVCAHIGWPVHRFIATV